MSNDINSARVIAFYLPQFHPVPENDEWWGKGFTEWTNVGKARSLFPGHYQPKVPADLGYYDLRVSETRKAQADMAREYGIEGFCYWHYWFGNGKRLLERPFNEVLASGEPDFPFCLAWANESWRGYYHGIKAKETLIDQLYPGEEDYIAHFNAVLPAFKDKRYITVDGKPLFMIYHPFDNQMEINTFIKLWRELAVQNGLEGIFFVGQTYHWMTKRLIWRIWVLMLSMWYVCLIMSGSSEAFTDVPVVGIIGWDFRGLLVMKRLAAFLSLMKRVMRRLFPQLFLTGIIPPVRGGKVWYCIVQNLNILGVT